MSDNILRIGKKGALVYVASAVLLLNKNSGTLLIQARGKAISKAVDVAEITRTRFFPDLKVDKIETSTQIMDSDPKKEPANVSCIEISLSRRG